VNTILSQANAGITGSNPTYGTKVVSIFQHYQPTLVIIITPTSGVLPWASNPYI